MQMSRITIGVGDDGCALQQHRARDPVCREIPGGEEEGRVGGGGA